MYAPKRKCTHLKLGYKTLTVKAKKQNDQMIKCMTDNSKNKAKSY